MICPGIFSYETIRESKFLTSKHKVMKKLSLCIVFIFLVTKILFSQQEKDSLVLFSDLKYHSEFEKTALHNFVCQKQDTFNLFLAIDEQMTAEKATNFYKTYKSVFDELKGKKIDDKKIVTNQYY